MIDCRKQYFTFIIFFFCSFYVIRGNAQDTILVQNPSFEIPIESIREFDKYNFKLGGWKSLDAKGESPPNLHSGDSELFGVKSLPSDGSFFLGMVTRNNESWESVVQLLSRPLKKGNTYSFSIDLCYSKLLKSVLRKKNGRGFTRPVKFDNGAIFRIQGSNSRTNEFEVLAESEIILNEEWIRMNFILEPSSDYDLFILEAFFDLSQDNGRFKNANVLLDNCSPIIEIANRY